MAPNFLENSELARYIDEDQRKAGNRPDHSAFLSNPGEDHLSVNSLEIETIQEIADYYRGSLQVNDEPIAVSTHKVAYYTDAGRKAGAVIAYDRSASQWNYQAQNGWRQAYKHRPVGGHGGRPASPSHSGVEFVNALDALAERNFARQMAKKGKFHLS